MCAYSVFNTFPVYPLSAKPLILLAFCRYRYHTSLAGRITENNFDLLLAKTQKEQAELKEKAAEARKRLDDEARLAVDAREWVESIQEYESRL